MKVENHFSITLQPRKLFSSPQLGEELGIMKWNQVALFMSVIIGIDIGST